MDGIEAKKKERYIKNRIAIKKKTERKKKKREREN